MSSCMVPWKSSSPPFTPASGPMSIIWSAARITFSSFSTTMTVLPRFFKALSTSISRSVSRGCSPMLGSSKMYMEPTKADPSEVANLMRWYSPPERLEVRRLSVKYPSPTWCINSNRLLISFKSRLANLVSCAESWIVWIK